MWWGTYQKVGILFLAGIGLTTGCSTGVSHHTEGPMTSSLLFGCDQSAVLATRIGRSEWPATYSWVEGPEDTIFLDYYRDYQGSESLEQSNPRRLFRSYRIGTQHR